LFVREEGKIKELRIEGWGTTPYHTLYTPHAQVRQNGEYLAYRDQT
jgi:hypothetical protein